MPLLLLISPISCVSIIFHGLQRQLAFTNLQQHIAKLLTLAMPNFNKPFVLETKAYGVAIGAVMSQDSVPLTFFIRKMCPRLQSSLIYVREMYAINKNVKRWRQYLLGHPFYIYTNQKILRSLLTQTI